MKPIVSDSTIGTLYALSAFALWGILPVYWKLLTSLPPTEVLAHRVFWSAVFVVGLLMYMGKHNFVDLLRNAKYRVSLILTGALIGLNWFVYIFAVQTDRIVEASMGYYINPLISIFLGLIVLKERLSRLQWVALILALIGVLVIVIQHGRVPWIALVLSGSFGLYGLVKKMMNLDALSSLGIETLLLTPLAVVYIGTKAVNGTGSCVVSEPKVGILLICSGAITALPLYWFAQSARRIPLSRIGFLQYIAPTLMLAIGVGVYGESFTVTHMVSFGFIWFALVLYTISLLRRSRHVEI